MGYYEPTLSALPYTALKLNSGNTAYVDMTGRGNTPTGSLVLCNSILAGSDKSHSLSGGTALTLPTVLFKKGMENNPFSLAAVFQPLNTLTSISMLSHNGIYDGLVFDGDFIKFSVNLTSGMVTAKWPVPDIMEVYHVVGVYMPDRIQLWIDGELVAETDLPESPAFVQEASSTLYIGQSPLTTGRAVIDGIALFARALDSKAISYMYRGGTDTQSNYEIPQQFGGSSIDFTERNIAQQTIFDDDNGWAGVFTNTSATSGYLVPLYDQTTLLSIAGTWVGSVPLAAIGANIYGIRPEWNGDGVFTIQVSFNGGSSWTTLTNGKLIAGTYNMATTNIVMDVKVTFAGGVLDDTAVVRDLRFTVYANATVNAVPRTHTFTVATGGTTNPDVNKMIERNLMAGLSLDGAAAHTLSAPTTTTPASIAAVQFQFKYDGVTSGTTAYLIDSRASNAGYLAITDSTRVLSWAGMSAVYVNGALTTSGSLALRKGEMYDIIAVYSTALSTASSVGSGNFIGQISLINLYPTAPNATQAGLMFSQYFKRQLSGITDDAAVTIFEPATPFNIYGLDWSITSGG